MSKTINCRELRKRYEMDGADRTVAHLTEALNSGDLKPEDFSLRDLAESLVPNGEALLREMNPRGDQAASPLGNDPSAFNQVTGTIIESKIRNAYNKGIFAVSKCVATIPTRCDGEKIHASQVSDGTATVEPGEQYPIVGLSGDYVETPSTTKHGLIVPITREAIFFDRTHLVLSKATEVGETLALNKEKRILDMVLGLANTYNYNGVAHDTYQTGATPWKNVLPGNVLQDWDNIDAAENLLGAMIDPSSGEHLLAEIDTVLVMPQLRTVAHRLLHASELAHQNAASAPMSAVPSPFAGYTLIASRLAYQRLLEASPVVTNPENVWIIGNFAKAFAYMENWPITVTRSSIGSEADFTQDVVVRFKASERGTPAILNPRYVVKCTA